MGPLRQTSITFMSLSPKTFKITDMEIAWNYEREIGNQEDRLT